jgi:hypothetical protein
VIAAKQRSNHGAGSHSTFCVYLSCAGKEGGCTWPQSPQIRSPLRRSRGRRGSLSIVSMRKPARSIPKKPPKPSQKQRSQFPKFAVVIGPSDRGCCQVTYRLGSGRERTATLTLLPCSISFMQRACCQKMNA